MEQHKNDEINVYKRIVIFRFSKNPIRICNIDSTDYIYTNFESAYRHILTAITDEYGGITNDTIRDEFKGIITFKRNDMDEGNEGHSMTVDIWHGDDPIIKYAILNVLTNDKGIVYYRGRFIEPFNNEYLITDKDGKSCLTIKKSLDLALFYIDTYLALNIGEE